MKNYTDIYSDEAKKKWGHTDAYKQSLMRTKHWTKAKYKLVEEEGRAIAVEIARATDAGIQSKQVQDLIRKHYEYIRQFYDCSPEMYRELGIMYVTDRRFTAFYDTIKPGLARFVCDAIAYFVDNHQRRTQ
jgi:MerR family transcriptional regulator, thiopeptide resistance regulator